MGLKTIKVTPETTQLSIDELRNNIILAHVLAGLKVIPNESVDMVVTSPPYWALRDYDTTPVIWDGKEKCSHLWEQYKKDKINLVAGNPAFNHPWRIEATDTPEHEHEWDEYEREKNVWGDDATTNLSDRKDQPNFQLIGKKTFAFCTKCDAWLGQLGLEPDFNLYITHLIQIFEEIKRILKPYGTLWVNIGDTYYTKSGSGFMQDNITGDKSMEMGLFSANEIRGGDQLPPKSLVCVPDRFKIAMVENGWICRNEIIWHKPSALPQSQKDRFTNDFEKIYFFVKSSDDLFWTNPIRKLIVGKQPPGINGEENLDWFWNKHKTCGGTGQVRRTKKGGHIVAFNSKIKDTIVEDCKTCEGKGIIKSSLWTSHDYFFQTQYEPLQDESYKKKKKYRGNNKKDYDSAMAQKPSDTKRNILETIDYELGRIKRTTWSISSDSFTGSHFAVFPQKLIETPIDAGCPTNVCQKCGLPDMFDYVTKSFKQRPTKTDTKFDTTSGNTYYTNRSLATVLEKKVLTQCDCGENRDAKPGIVMDVFFGRGTTGKVAKDNGKDFIGIDLNEDYIELAKKYIGKLSKRLSEFL